MVTIFSNHPFMLLYVVGVSYGKQTGGLHMRKSFVLSDSKRITYIEILSKGFSSSIDERYREPIQVLISAQLCTHGSETIIGYLYNVTLVVVSVVVVFVLAMH